MSTQCEGFTDAVGSGIAVLIALPFVLVAMLIGTASDRIRERRLRKGLHGRVFYFVNHLEKSDLLDEERAWLLRRFQKHITETGGTVGESGEPIEIEGFSFDKRMTFRGENYVQVWQGIRIRFAGKVVAEYAYLWGRMSLFKAQKMIFDNAIPELSV